MRKTNKNVVGSYDNLTANQQRFVKIRFIKRKENFIVLESSLV